jgi:PPOX class probable F420-dependent enzyme
MTLIDYETEFGTRAATHLREDVVVWMTTVSPAGSPLPSPVWFLWDGAASVAIYSLPGARVRNIDANPRVALNFGGNGKGGDIVALSGRASIDQDLPGADADSGYLAKYTEHITRLGMTPESFAAKYNIPVRVALTGLRGH